MEFNKEDFLKEVKGIMSDSLKGLVSEKDLNTRVEAINKQLETLNSREDNHEEVAELKKSVDTLVTAMGETNEALKTQGEEMKALTEQGKKKAKVKGTQTFYKAIEDAFMEKKDVILTEKNDDYGKRLSLKDYFDNHEGTPSLTLKAESPK